MCKGLSFHEMQAVILAAGRGARLRPITDNIPKCLVEVNGIPFIVNELNALSKHKEITQIILVVGYKKEEIIRRIGDNYCGVKITYVENDSWAHTNNIYSLWLATKYINKDFILMEADIFFDHQLIESIFHNRDKNLVMLSKYESHMSGTIVELEKNKKSIKGLIFPSNQGENFDYSDKYKTINIYYFTLQFFRTYFSPNLDVYIKTRDSESYWELILGVLIYLNTPNIFPHVVDKQIKWFEVDDLADLDMAEYIFKNTSKRLHHISHLHGGYWRYDFLDFCYLFNPYFPSREFVNRLSMDLPRLINNYPSGASRLSNLLSRWYFDNEFNEKNITVGNGASEFIRIINRNIIKNVTIPVPTFNEYEDLSEERINRFPLEEEDDFILDSEEFVKSAKKSGSNFAVIINPNNPTSSITKKSELEYIMDNLRHLDGIIVDESFLDFAGDRNVYSVQSLIDEYPNLIVLRSLSKEFGVPGLRIGYILTSNFDINSKIRFNLPIWNINSIAERFIELLPRYREDYEQSLVKITSDREKFYSGLKKNDTIKPFKPYGNFVFCKTRNKSLNSQNLCAELFKKYNIFIKDCSNKASLNQEYIRLSVRTDSDNQILLEALSEIDNLGD